LKIVVVICVFIFILISCQQKKTNVISASETIVDSLLLYSNDLKLDQQKRLQYNNRLWEILQTKENDSITRVNYFKLSAGYYNIGQLEKYLAVCRKAYNLALQKKDSLNIAKSLYRIGDYYSDNFENDSAYYYYTRAEKTYLRVKNNNDDIVRLKYNKANILLFEKDFLGCEIAIVQVLKLAKHNKNTRLIYDCYITLANALDGLNDSTKALEYYNKAFETTILLKEDPQYLILKAQSYNYIGELYKKQKQYRKATNYFKNALAFGDLKETLPYLYAAIINNLAYSNLKLGYKDSLIKFEEALTISKNSNSIPIIVSSKYNLSEYYLSQGNIDQAILYSQDALKMAHDNKIYEDELKTLQLLARIDYKNNEQYNNRFITLTDSLQNNERATRNKYARIEFETDEILTEKKVIETEKDKISQQRWVIVGFGSFFILVIGLAYMAKVQHSRNKELQFEQEKQKANEEIYALMLDQQSKINDGRLMEKKRISQELHDGVMSKLTSTRLNLFVLNKKTDEETIQKCLVHINNIQAIEKEIRTIAHDLSNEFFTKNDSFKAILESLFLDQNELTPTAFKIEIDQTIEWDTIPSTFKMNMYRILQESIQNAHKYAQAHYVNASIAKHEKKLHINISDDGVGFDVEKAKTGIGFKNMNERIKTLQGSLEIDSVIGKGTNINLIIPL
jgi:signal transduction histidine kinase